MAANKDAVSFDDIIKAGREKREKEKLAEELLGQGRREKQRLADEILGKGRKKIPSGNGNRTTGAGGSLTGRAGIAKAYQRSNSGTPKPKPDILNTSNHDTQQSRAVRTARPPRETHEVRQNKNERLFEAAVTQSQRKGTTAKRPGEELNIRGTAGPYVVVGTNFAPGTTAADIESAMIPSGGEMQSCRIISSTPTVIAEMIFSEKHNAETVISTFNNKKADGRILHVYMKTGAPLFGPVAASVPKAAPTEPRGSRIDLTQNEQATSYDSQREQSDRRRRAEPEFQDGSYGFAAKEDEMEVDQEVLGVEKPSNEPARPDSTPAQSDHRNIRDHERHDDRRDDRRNVRYNGPQDGGRGRPYFDRYRDGGRPRQDYRLHSDDLYPRPRGRGFR